MKPTNNKYFINIPTYKRRKTLIKLTMTHTFTIRVFIFNCLLEMYRLVADYLGKPTIWPVRGSLEHTHTVKSILYIFFKCNVVLFTNIIPTCIISNCEFYNFIALKNYFCAEIRNMRFYFKLLYLRIVNCCTIFLEIND